MVKPKFNYDRDFSTLDFRAHPEEYQIGVGEQGVFHVEPYKSELMPLWRFKTPEIARESSAKLWAKFEEYRAQQDFVGMDMARKFLQMGYTRSRRYTNHKGGRKFDAQGEALPLTNDPIKAESAAIFYEAWQRALHDPEYGRLKAEHLKVEQP